MRPVVLKCTIEFYISTAEPIISNHFPFIIRANRNQIYKVAIVKVVKIVRARDYWIFLVAQQSVPRSEMDELGLLGI